MADMTWEEKRLSEPAWHWLDVTAPRQDNIPIDLEDGTHYEPTYNWIWSIAGLRSDGTHFYVRCSLPPDAVVDRRQLEMTVYAFQQGLMSLDSYHACQCKVNAPCESHKV